MAPRLLVLLQDLDADRKRGASRRLLNDPQWDDVLATFERGVSVEAMYKVLRLNVQPFFSDAKSFYAALMNERTRRKKIKEKAVASSVNGHAKVKV